MSDEDLRRRANGVVEVELRGVPLPLYRRSRQHGDDLQREFALIIHGEQTADETSVPARLLNLITDLRGRFGSHSDPTYAELDAAADRGDEHADVVFRVPAATAPAAQALAAMLDEVDEYCRQGELLTLATPEDQVAFRRWFLEEFIRQIAGEPPRPWPGA